MKAVKRYVEGWTIIFLIAVIVFSCTTSAIINSSEWWTQLAGVSCLVGLFALIGTIRIALEFATAKSREVQEKQKE